MNKKTYRFIETTGHIPGIPGEFHAGQEVDVDEDTNTVLATRLFPEQQPIVVSPQPENKRLKALGEAKKE